MNPCHYALGNHTTALLRLLPWGGHPRHYATLCGRVSNNPVALYHPLPYGRRAAPSKKDGGALEGKVNNYATPCKDNTVTSGRRDRSPPSPSALCDHPHRPQRHPGHCITIPDVVEACGDETPPRWLLYPRTASRQRHPRTLTRALAEQETSTPPPSKSLLDAHRTRHDAPLEARFARTAVYSATLYTMPLHVDEIVQHACKLPHPWPIKKGAVP
jgi:hypothetical protein